MSTAEPLNPGNLKPGCWKRKGSEEEGEDPNSKVKKAKYSWYFTLESESPQPTSSDEDESIYSIQERETEFAQDTSDTCTNTWVTSGDDAMHEEYEPASLSGNENTFIDCMTSSDPELELSDHTVGYVAALAAAICDSDAGLADDSDDSLTSRDSEISHADYWTCVQCKNVNKKPFFRLCEKCYQERKLFLPPRPKGRRRRRQPKKHRVRALERREVLVSQDSGLGLSQSTMSFDLIGSSLEKSSNSELSGQTLSGAACLSQDSGLSSSQPISSSFFSSQSSQEDNNSQETVEREETKGEDSVNCESQESQKSVATTASEKESFDLSDVINEVDLVEKIRAAANEAKLRNDQDNNLCRICTVGPKNAVFIHGRTSHICCCYRCAIRVWKVTKHCPICKRKVTDVVKTYFV